MSYARNLCCHVRAVNLLLTCNSWLAYGSKFFDLRDNRSRLLCCVDSWLGQYGTSSISWWVWSKSLQKGCFCQHNAQVLSSRGLMGIRYEVVGCHVDVMWQTHLLAICTAVAEVLMYEFTVSPVSLPGLSRAVTM